MSVTIIPDRLERLLADDFHLRGGPGKGINSHVDVCAMQAVAWLAGEDISDMPDCACPAIRHYVIRLNDSRLFRDHRDSLKPFLPRIVGTRGSREILIRRGFIATDYAVRIFSPILLRALKRDEWAAELESLPPIDSQTSAYAALDATSKIRRAAVAAASASAVAAASASAVAAASAVASAVVSAVVYTGAAASAVADAYAYAAAYAAAAAYAVAYTDAAAAAVADAVAYTDAAAAAVADADAAASLREKSLECLEAMISCS